MKLDNQVYKENLKQFIGINNDGVIESINHMLLSHNISLEEFECFYARSSQENLVKIGVELSIGGVTPDSVDQIQYICANSGLNPNSIYRTIASIKKFLVLTDPIRSKLTDHIGECVNTVVNELPVAMSIDSIARNNPDIFNSVDIFLLDVLKLMLKKNGYKDYSDCQVLKFLKPLKEYNPLNENFKCIMKAIMKDIKSDIYGTFIEYWPGLVPALKFSAAVLIKKIIKRD